jgi:ABC-type Mn2+/Zn2+ transport system permease subunit
MSELLQLFGASLAALAAVALAAPLIGSFLHARGTAFHGLVLPQLATFGIALGHVAPPLAALVGLDGIAGWLAAGTGDNAHAGHEHGGVGAAHVDLTLGWATLAVGVGLGLLTWLARRPGSDSARLAGAFAVATGGTALCAQLSPTGALHLGALMGGEALAVSHGDAWRVGLVCLVTVAFVVWRWRDLSMALHDREFALALGVRVVRLDLWLAVATAALVIVGTLALGPLPLFALLVLPPLGARSGARSMAGFLTRSTLTSVMGAATGAALSFGADLPLGASIVAGATAAAGVVWGLSGAR